MRFISIHPWLNRYCTEVVILAVCLNLLPGNSIANESVDICASEMAALQDVVLVPGQEVTDRLPIIHGNFHSLRDCIGKVSDRLNETENDLDDLRAEKAKTFHASLTGGGVDLRLDRRTSVTFTRPSGVGLEDDTFASGGARVPFDGIYFISFQATVDGYTFKDRGSQDDTFLYVMRNNSVLLRAWKPQPITRGSVAVSGMFPLKKGDNIHVQGLLTGPDDSQRDMVRVQQGTLFVTRMQ